MNETRSQSLRECCCGPSNAECATPPSLPDASWIEGTVRTAVGEIPRVSTELQFADHLGSWKARWGFGRMAYQVAPGLYAVGNPTPESPVLVSANYKMSFDRLREELDMTQEDRIREKGGEDGWHDETQSVREKKNEKKEEKRETR